MNPLALHQPTLAGWLGLPVLVLLLVVASMSMAFQDRLLAQYQWRGQLQAVADEQAVWQDFTRLLVDAPEFSQASDSHCLGFCPLQQDNASLEQIEWRSEGRTVLYQWHRYERDDGMEFHRLCASINQQSYHCWWWQNRILRHQGWLTLLD